MNKEILTELRRIAGEEAVLVDEPMSRHVTFRAGGKADYFVTAESEAVLTELIHFLRKENISWYLIGNGSNVLFVDDGYHGVVVKIGRFPEDLKVEGNRLRAGAGVLLSQMAKKAEEAGLTGLEFAAGIPGTVGGAVVMNAGAYGGEMKDCIVRVKVLDKEGKICWLSKEELKLSYRHSIMMEEPFVVLEAEVLLEPGNREEISGKMKELAHRRREKQPLEYPSAGSTFKRPEGYFAGKLIEDAGLKGKNVGDAQVSEKHSGFVINKGNATAGEILELISQVQNKVYEQFGVRLEMEVRVVK